MGGLQVLLVGQVIERHLKFDSSQKLEQPLNQTRSAPTAEKHKSVSLGAWFGLKTIILKLLQRILAQEKTSHF